jgi:hypothetical protein
MQVQTQHDLLYYEQLLNRLQREDLSQQDTDFGDLDSKYALLTNDVLQRLFKKPAQVMTEKWYYMAECCRLNQQAIRLKEEVMLKPAIKNASFMLYYLTINGLISCLGNLYRFYDHLEEPLYMGYMDRKEYLQYLRTAIPESCQHTGR